jgi:hypothetical protein
MTNGSLKGWKDIAEFLETSVRSAHRWEQEFGLPVQRVQGTKGDLVFADPAELLRWRTGRKAAASATDDDATPGMGSADGVAARDSGNVRPVYLQSLRSRWHVAIVVLLVVGVVATVILARWFPSAYRGVAAPAQATKTNTPSVVAETTSTALSLMKVIVEGETSRTMVVGVFDGGMASLAFDKGPSLGLVGTRQGDELTVFVLLLSPAPGQSGGTATQVGTLHLQRDRPVSWAHEGLRMQVAWLGTRSPSPAVPGSRPARARECAITCSRLVVTAAAVETPCGKCCDPTACAGAY